jgi:hypothetical protein
MDTHGCSQTLMDTHGHSWTLTNATACPWTLISTNFALDQHHNVALAMITTPLCCGHGS